MDNKRLKIIAGGSRAGKGSHILNELINCAFSKDADNSNISILKKLESLEIKPIGVIDANGNELYFK